MISEVLRFNYNCSQICLMEMFDPIVSLELKRSHNNQQYIAWGKIIHFSLMPKIIRILNQITNQITNQHSTSALVSEILKSVLQTVQKNNKQFTYGQYIFTDCTKDNVQNTHTYTQYT